MIIPSILFITAGLLLTYVAYLNYTRHAVANEIINATLSVSDDNISITEYVARHPQISSRELATEYNVTLRTAQRAIKNYKNKNK